MRLGHLVGIVAVVCLVASTAAAAEPGFISANGWVLLAALTVLPAAGLIVLWNFPFLTVAEAVRIMRDRASRQPRR